MTRLAPDTAAGQMRLGLDRQPSHARADFIVSTSNTAAAAAIDAWPNWPGGKLVLVGPRGSGKTHLASAWAARSAAATFGDEITSDSVPILFEDADRRSSDEVLFHALNRADAGAGLLITSRTAPSAWASRLPDLRSRLNALTVATIEQADDALLSGVMAKLFSERNIRPKPDLIPYVIRRIERSVAAAQDFVRAIDELAAAEGREINLALARRLVRLASPEADV